MIPGAILPLLVAAGVTYSQRDTIADSMETALDVVRVAVTRYELNNVRTAVYATMLSGEYLIRRRGGMSEKQQMLNDFPNFIRANMRSDKRDPAVDFWGNEYGIESESKRYILYSYGPDGTGSTEDDVEVSVWID